MSYVVHVWESPRPATVDEAARIALAQGGDVLGQNPAFLALAERLRGRYPCLTTHPEDSVWSDGPLDGVTDERALVLGIRADHGAVLAYLAEQASQLGLSVYDMQQHAAWLPGGTRLPAPQPLTLSFEGMTPNDSLSFFEFKAGLRRFMGRVFGPLGYAMDTDELGCTLALPNGWIGVGVATANYDPSFYYSFYFTIRHDRAANIVACMRDVDPAYRGRASSVLIRLRQFQQGSRDDDHVEGLRQFEAALSRTEEAIRAHILPLLARCRTLEALERYVNVEKPVQTSCIDDSFVSDVTLAWLARNPAWEAIAEARLAALHLRNMRVRLMLLRLVDYLRGADRDDPDDLPRGQLASIPAFIAAYDGSQHATFACVGGGPWGTPEFSDGNDFYREHLIGEARGNAATPLVLVRDLFLAELDLARGKDEWRRLCRSATLLLERGGLDALPLLVASVPAERIRTWLGAQTGLRGPLARVLSSACAQQAYLLGDDAQAERYRVLGDFLEPAASCWT